VRYVQGVLDLLSSTDMGRLVPPLEDSNAAIEALNWELRELRALEEKREAEAYELGSEGNL